MCASEAGSEIAIRALPLLKRGVVDGQAASGLVRHLESVWQGLNVERAEVPAAATELGVFFAMSHSCQDDVLVAQAFVYAMHEAEELEARVAALAPYV
jgi:hypothetical protein